VIWVPEGSRAGDPFHDATRDAARYDAIAGFLLSCGARALPTVPEPARDAVAPALL
jgi:hypothetical protein